MAEGTWPDQMPVYPMATGLKHRCSNGGQPDGGNPKWTKFKIGNLTRDKPARTGKKKFQQTCICMCLPGLASSNSLCLGKNEEKNKSYFSNVPFPN